MNKILIRFETISFEARLNDSPTAQAIWEALPIERLLADGQCLLHLLRSHPGQHR
jgi:hypothetical protein